MTDEDMAEEEWLRCPHPEYMVAALRGETSERKLRLLAVALCGRVEHLMADDGSRRAVRVAERYADDRSDGHQLAEAEASARRARDAAFVRWEADTGSDTPPAGVGYWAADAALCAVNGGAFDGVRGAVSAAGMALAWSEDESLVAGPDHWPGFELTGPWPQVIRDVLGNPFRPVALDPSWLTPAVTAIAHSIYDERAFDRMQGLADALEEAGCTDDEVLTHCRGGGDHVRGCWVVDLLLGKK